ncbi:MAG: hypothetical protein AB7N76_19575 [Planctomycetota bacterium]
MSDTELPPEEAPQPAKPRGSIRPLRAASTQVEGVTVGAPADGEEPQAVFEPLRAASTHVEQVEVEETPLVLMDDEDALDTDSEDLTVPELVGEVKRLRAHLQIARTERTSAAGRRYALEVVIESLREKVEQAAALLEGVEDTGPLGDLIRSLQLVLGDARRIADTKAVLEKDLEEERRRHLEERQAFEQRRLTLEDSLFGLRSERDSLRSTVARLEEERLTWMEKLADAQDRLNDHDLALSEVEAKASERLSAYMERAQELESQLERLQGERDGAGAARAELEGALGEAVGHAERATQRLRALEPELEEAGERLRAAEAWREGAEEEAERLRAKLVAANAELEEVRAAAKAEAERREQTAAAARAEREAELLRLAEELETARIALDTARADGDAAREASEGARGELTEAYAALEQTREELAAARGELEADRESARVVLETAQQEAEGARDQAAAAGAELEGAREQAERALVRVGELEAQRDELSQARERGERAVSALRAELDDARRELEDARAEADQGRTQLAASTTRLGALPELEARVKALEGTLSEQRAALVEVKPMLERLDKENQRLSRLVGDARARGRVNVEELMARAAMLRRLERLTELS